MNETTFQLSPDGVRGFEKLAKVANDLHCIDPPYLVVNDNETKLAIMSPCVGMACAVKTEYDKEPRGVLMTADTIRRLLCLHKASNKSVRVQLEQDHVSATSEDGLITSRFNQACNCIPNLLGLELVQTGVQMPLKTLFDMIRCIPEDMPRFETLVSFAYSKGRLHLQMKLTPDTNCSVTSVPCTSIGDMPELQWSHKYTRKLLVRLQTVCIEIFAKVPNAIVVLGWESNGNGGEIMRANVCGTGIQLRYVVAPSFGHDADSTDAVQ